MLPGVVFPIEECPMRSPIPFVLAVGVLAATLACAPAPPPPPAGPTPAEMVAAADALDRQFLDAFNKGDVDAVTALYWNSPDLVSFGPDGMGTKGFEAAKAGTAEMFKAMPGAKLEFGETHNAAHGDVVLGWGLWKLTIPAEKGPAQVIEGRYSDAKAMKDGKWVFLMDHASVPLPPPPAPAKK
jgi:ketosteroid isomerase-like protein